MAPCIQSGERTFFDTKKCHPYMQKYATQLICCFQLKGKAFLMETDVVSCEVSYIVCVLRSRNPSSIALNGAVRESIARRARAGILFMHHMNHIQYLCMDDDIQLCFPAIYIQI